MRRTRSHNGTPVRYKGRARSPLRYQPRDRSQEAPLVRAIQKLARRHPRWGYRRIRARLEKGGWSVNLKRIRRLWIEQALPRPVRRRKRRKWGPKTGTSANSCVNKPARFKNDVWTYDFVADRTSDGRPLKWLTLVDEYTRECLVLHVGRTITGQQGFRFLLWRLFGI